MIDADGRRAVRAHPDERAVPVPRAYRGLSWAAAFMTAAVWLGGCATSDDPHAGGFVSGVVGLAGGGYQRRVDAREGTYEGELSAQQRLQAQAKSLEQERAAVRTDLNRANARLADLERRLAQQRALLRTSGGPSAQQRRLAQAQAQVRRTKGALRGVRPDEQPVGDLKARSAAIQRDLDQIDSMVGTISGKGF